MSFFDDLIKAQEQDARRRRLREFLLTLRDAGVLIVLCMIAWWLERHS